MLRLNYLGNRHFYDGSVSGSLLKSEDIEIEFETPWWKRVMDILFSSVVLLVLSPILLLVALLIKLDSKGPIVYKSKRVGSGYHVFDLFKFRTMHTDADQPLSKLGHLNMYKNSLKEENNEEQLCEACREKGAVSNYYFTVIRRFARRSTKNKEAELLHF